jgi:hypothetical protein
LATGKARARFAREPMTRRHRSLIRLFFTLNYFLADLSTTRPFGLSPPSLQLGRDPA